jgi:hypothetical protein
MTKVTGLGFEGAVFAGALSANLGAPWREAGAPAKALSFANSTICITLPQKGIQRAYYFCFP